MTESQPADDLTITTLTRRQRLNAGRGVRGALTTLPLTDQPAEPGRPTPGLRHIIGILPNIFNLLALDPAWQQVARGAVLLAVVVQLVILPGGRIGGLRLRTPRQPAPEPKVT